MKTDLKSTFRHKILLSKLKRIIMDRSNVYIIQTVKTYNLCNVQIVR